MDPRSSRFSYRFSTSSSFPGPDYDSFRRFHFHRRPSRLLWFAIGAASATVFIMHKESKQSEKAMYWKACSRPRVQQSQPSYGDLSQVLADPLPTVLGTGSDAPSTPSPYPYSHPHHHAHWSWGFARERPFQYPPPPPAGVPNGNGSENANGQAPAGSALPTVSTESPSVPTPAPAPVAAHSVPWGFESRFEQQKTEWEQERERLLAKAQDTMSELSESTLDSLSSTLEALKAKLVEHRVKQEQQQKLIEKELEEQKKKPVRYV
ncbi:hypothetical protein GYMLUDRAFT_73844 [Collybiopsis luxurians FD-317 M1]|uniref:Uncharacterized protein n=1 Tax=Collybiopsis luxurians FD-317 M1 TaxID=944289 RepID=A0A0D0CWB6_9AGAR|nr:hypothetical protein GYMLUDRAFT_73844 [Collybiopsis luxurians FD-317 M1]